MPPSRRVGIKKGLKSVPGRNPSRGGNRLESFSRFYATRTDANTQSMGTVNPLAQIKAPLPASKPPLQGQLGQAGRTSPADRMQSCARDSFVPQAIQDATGQGSSGPAILGATSCHLERVMFAQHQAQGVKHIGRSRD